MRALSEKLDGESGMSKSLHEELVLSRQLRDEEAERFAQMSVLLDALLELAEEGDDALDAALSVSAAAQCVDESGLVVGVTPADLEHKEEEKEEEKETRTEHLMRVTAPRLELRLDDKATRLAQLAGTSSLDKLCTEARNVAASMHVLAVERAQVEALRASVLMQELQLMEQLDQVAAASKERVELAALHGNWLAAQAEGMASKMALLEKRMMKVKKKRHVFLFQLENRKLMVVAMLWLH